MNKVNPRTASIGVVCLLIIILGISLAGRNHDPYPVNIISSTIGWGYFFAWSVSFYPQLLLNWRRKSAKGLSTDFLWYNLLGFGCYSMYSFSFYAIPDVQESYKKRHDGKANLVTLNDVVFAVHAFTITALTIAQVYLLQYEKEQVTLMCKVLCAVAICSVGAVGISVSVIDWLYFVSFIKLLVSTIKYCPQVYMNCTRKSTVGWSMGNVFLDFSGGCLSLLQLVVDGSSTHNWAGVIGNPVKFGLGFISMGFDIIFMVQHFILFPEHEDFEDLERRESEERMLSEEDVAIQ